MQDSDGLWYHAYIKNHDIIYQMEMYFVAKKNYISSF